MADTAIEWTERSWNPIVGCTIVSPGCTNCYAMTMAARIERMGQETGKPAHYAGLTQQTKAGAVWTGKVAKAPERTLLEPLRRKKPTTYFVNSMGDLFHEDVPDAWIDEVFAVMVLCPQHTFQVLTKRSARMRTYMSDPAAPALIARWIDELLPNLTVGQIDNGATNIEPVGTVFEPHWPLPNVWAGASAEDQKRANERIPDLLSTLAAVRFVSAEPLLGGIRFDKISFAPSLGDMVTAGTLNALTGTVASYPITTMQGRGFLERREFNAKLDWIIAGGESGPGARPMHPDWPRQIRDQCAAAGTAFFFKQWGEWQPREWCRDGGTHALNSHPGHSFQKIQSHPDSIERVGAGPDWVALAKVGKKAAGRLLDGAEHNAMPEAR